MSFDHNSSPLTQQQLRDSERLIHQLKVGDLHKLLEKLHHSKKGLKQDLVDRVLRLLKDPVTQKAVFNYLNSEMSKRSNQNSYNGQNRGYPGIAPFSANQNTYGRIGMAQNGIGGSTMYGAQSMIQQTTRPAPSDLKIVPLPFYDVQSTLVAPMELSAVVPPAQRYTSKLAFTFNIDQEMFHAMSYDLNKKSLPRHEIQLRFFNCTDLKEPQKDDFPLNINVKMNGMIITLPGLIPTNKPNVEAKRPSRPVCLTQPCQRRPGAQQLSIDWMCDKRSWAMAVYYVHRVNADILYRRMVDNPAKHHEIEVTRREIIKKLGGNDDDGIAMDQLKIGLLCPLVKVRMTCPARCSDCTHLQCFDLLSYLMMNEKRPVWNCPVCSGYAPYEKLIIDEYFKDVLTKVDSSTTEVELKPDGRFEMLKNDEAFDISSDEDDGVQLKKEVKSETGLGNATTSNGNGAAPTAKTYSNDDIIVLSDSDDEDPDVARAISNSLKDDEPRTPPPELENCASGSGGTKRKAAIEIITLDDTPPRPSEAKRRNENVSSTSSAGSSSINNNNNSSSSAALIQRTDSTSSNVSVGRIPLPNGAPTTSQQPATLVEALEKVHNSDKLLYHNQQDIFSPSSMHQNQMDYSYPNTAYPSNNWRLPSSGSAMQPSSSMHNYTAPPPTPMTPVHPLIGRQINDVMGPMGGGPPPFNFNPQNFNQPQPPNMPNMMGGDLQQYGQYPLQRPPITSMIPLPPPPIAPILPPVQQPPAPRGLPPPRLLIPPPLPHHNRRPQPTPPAPPPADLNQQLHRMMQPHQQR